MTRGDGMKHTLRERKTGRYAYRYAHTWGWQGYDANGHQWEACDDCGKWRDNGAGNKVTAIGPAQTWYNPHQTGELLIGAEVAR